MNEETAQWARELSEKTPNVTIQSNGDLLEVIVWDEPTAQAIWAHAGQLGVPAGVIRVVRPTVFLRPYPSNDARNDAVLEGALKSTVWAEAHGREYLLSGLEPAGSSAPRVLVLGSMPGALSLDRQAYYAHPRNRFWWLMEQVFGIPVTAPYGERLQQLESHGVALWDVLHHCERVGSLDRDIVPASEVANDIVGYLRERPSLTRVVLNGTKSERSFRKHVQVKTLGRALDVRSVSSTSPANATISATDLLQEWRTALGMDTAGLDFR